MTEALHIGTRGWDIDAWQDTFYDEALPRDWRFCYFSNAIRAAVIPAGQWQHVGAGELTQWMEDSDPEFRFVAELPEWFNAADTGIDRSRVQAHLDLCDLLQPRLAARLWRAPRPLPKVDWWRARLDIIGNALPLCVDLGGQAPEVALAALLDEREISRCWHPLDESRPQAPGRYLVALMGNADLKTLRTVIEALVQWRGNERGAGLFLEATAQAPELAQQARVIAELLGE